MRKPPRKVLASYRRRRRARGLVRVEVETSVSDAPLLKEIAAELRTGARRATELRGLLRRTLRPEKSIRDLLAMNLPDDVMDFALVRTRDRGREVEL